jgi:hypothetical protein
MNNIIKRTWNQNRMVNIEDLSGMAFQAEDGGHTFEISGINDAGESVPLSGTVAGVFMRPDLADIAIVGSATDGVVSVTLPADCYAVNGRFALTIFVISDSQKVAVYAAVGTVARTSGGSVAGDTPQDVVDLINAINAAVATIPADYTDLMAAFAPTYSSSALYARGAYAWYDGVLYKALVDISTAESFTAAHWTAVSIGADAGVAIGQALGTEIYPISASGHIQLKVAGNTQGTTPTSSTTYSNIVLPVKKGDSLTLYLALDTSSTGYKGYVFADSNSVSVEREAVVDTLFGAELTAPEDGIFIANAPTASKSFVIKNGVSAMRTIRALAESVADVYSKYGIAETLTATIESGKAYRADNPNGVSASGSTTYTYAVKGLDVLTVSVLPIPTSLAYKLAMWYDADGNYIGCTDRVGSSTYQANVPLYVPSRASTLRISASNSATVRVEKRVMPVSTQKRVSLSNNVVTIENDKYTYVMSKHGHNNLFDLYRVVAKDGTILYTADTDWQGPYQVSAINNADGDAIAQGSTYTGGNHAYAFDGGSGTATARTSAIKVYADGTELTDGQTLPWNDCVSVEWTNYVQGWNTKKSDGTGREILMESPVWRFRPSDRIETENRIEALEDIRIGMYYGLQMAAAWLGSVLLPSAKRAVIAMSEFTPTEQGGIGTRFAGYNVTALGTGMTLTMGYDPIVDLGGGGGISSDEIKLTRVHTSTGKCYIYMAQNLDLDEDEIARYAGYYQFR